MFTSFYNVTKSINEKQYTCTKQMVELAVAKRKMFKTENLFSDWSLLNILRSTCKVKLIQNKEEFKSY